MVYKYKWKTGLWLQKQYLPEYITYTTTSIADPNEEDPLQSMNGRNDFCIENSPEPSASAIYFSPKEIRPLLTLCVPISTRKRKTQKSKVLTSTPVKEKQKTKFAKINTTVLKSIRKDMHLKQKIKETGQVRVRLAH